MEPENPAETQALLWRIVGRASPASVSPLYKVGVAAVALIMVLLPVFYVGVIALVAYAVYRHVLNPWYSLGQGWVGLLGYLAPLIIGPILVFFMIKPLFARRSQTAQAQRIDPDEEPNLFRFVYAICELVKAPRPRCVELDLRVNASAGFRRGMLDLLAGNLTLTIGLPFVAGLSIGELGGVLAHEFGHFAQGAAMRLTFIVRSVNNWFARVVYERDVWDDRLRSAAGRGDFRIRIIFHLARGTVWLTRRILWLLMNIGHGISCFMLRQMEFDADRFETLVAGSSRFAATTRRLQLLNIAWQRTLMLQQEAVATNRLVDNLPSLVAGAASRLPETVRQDVENLIGTGKTGWFDTHPSDRDRIKASEATASPGMLEAEGSATTLFRDFATTAQKQTINYYERECGIELKDISLHPFDVMLDEVETAAEEDRCIQNWFGPLLTFRTRWAFKPQEAPPATEAPTAERHAQLLTDARAAVDALLKADNEELAAFGARTLLDAGFIINKKEFGLRDATRDAAEALLADARSRIQREQTNLHEAVQVCGQRFANALQICRRNSSRAVQIQIDFLSDLLTRFGQLGEVIIRLRSYTSALELLLINSSRATNESLWSAAAEELSTSIEQDTARVVSAFENCDYPFSHARGKVPLAQFLVESQPHDQRIPRVFLRGRAALERGSNTHYRILARLAVFAAPWAGEMAQQ
jgi:Zn-dependent protease with chaperone function